jgi:hypothetical protein
MSHEKAVNSDFPALIKCRGTDRMERRFFP